MSVKILLAVALLALGYPIYKHENDRYTRSLHDCMDRFVRNEYTLQKDVCMHVHEREKCSVAIRESCLRAERENLQSPEECARLHWLQESELVALYYRVAGSTFALLALLLAGVLGSMYFTVQYWTADNQNRRMVDAFQDFFRPARQELTNYKRDRNVYYLD